MALAEQYDNFVRHETLRVAVCDVLEGKEPLLEPFRYGCGFLVVCLLTKDVTFNHGLIINQHVF